MRGPLRLGIGGKLVLSYGLMIAAIVALELLAQAVTTGSSAEYEERLARYHAMHRLRVSLAEGRASGERYLRELGEGRPAELRAGLEELGAMAEALEPYAAESLESYFEVRAARRGIAAYLPLAAEAYARREAGRADYYASFAKAERIAGYSDGYLSKLLSVSLAAGETRYRETAARAALYRKAVLAGILGVGALALAFAGLFASSIAAPIRRLALASERIAAGELEVEPVRAATGDEVETLARGFNTMAENIRDHIAGLREKAELERRLHEEELALVSMGRALREAQFMNLQDQMRPHFLFNALNTISRSALLEQASTTERLALGLGKLMRYSIGAPGSFVSLSEELAILREYLEFQSIRFGSRLGWKIEAEEALLGLQIPRFTLQPLVENAIRHGLGPLEAGGAVRVRAAIRAGRARILVADNGAGMSRETLGRLREAGGPGEAEPGPWTEGSGLGIASIRLRLALRYGDQARVALSSSPGRGTVVRISMPAQGERIEAARA
ncbi:MAG TPA: sensor histidine kinase [Spirochaetia bacterium]|nr:sensor histidine kinase [Spirochaetia bacterium]HRZ64394.1 sensor histidine kinase [Spirochaetia bacterium]